MPRTPLRRLATTTTAALITVGGLTAMAGPASASVVPANPSVAVWGASDWGQDDVPDFAGKDITAVSDGVMNSLALTSDGKVIEWGTGGGSGTSNVPASLSSEGVTAISAGYATDLALTSDGVVHAWGNNNYGGLNVPSSLAGRIVTAIAAGWSHELALTADGQVVAWGSNNAGESTVPASLTGKKVTAIAASNATSMALTSDGQVVVWGDAGGYGLANIPASLASKQTTAIAIGFFSALALTADGTVTAWGDDSMGQSDVPASLQGKTVTQISAGFGHSLALTSDGTVTGWGYGGGFGAETVPAGLQRVISISAGHHHSIALYEPAPVAVSGSVSVTGTATVGDTLTADSTLITDPASTQTGQWLRDGIAIDAATDTSYTLTNDDAGRSISYQVTASAPSYADTTTTSDEVGPVDGGTITLPTPNVSGFAVLDGTLTASLPTTTDPADAAVDYVWTRDGVLVGSGDTYRPTAADVGYALRVSATAHKAFFNNATAASSTDAVAAADFLTGPAAGITGTVKVGQTLTADVGATSPTPDDYTYQWFADGQPIPGASAATFHLTAAQAGTAITVQVTAVRAGYTPASSTSDPTADVGAAQAPTVDLVVGKSALRRGQSTTLTWTSQGAESLTASQGWTGTQDAAGTVTIHPTALGANTYVLTATNTDGTTTAQVTVDVTRQAAALTVGASVGLRLAGTRISVTAAGLDPAEPYTIRIGATRLATGIASSTGHVDRAVTIPARTAQGTATVTVTGSEVDRIGHHGVRVLSKTLSLTLAHAAVRASDSQKVTVRGLVAGERVTVTYQGRRISRTGAHANSHGVYTVTFNVHSSWGPRTVKATGQFAGRTVTRTFQVVHRCSSGHACR